MVISSCREPAANFFTSKFAISQGYELQWYIQKHVQKTVEKKKQVVNKYTNVMSSNQNDLLIDFSSTVLDILSYKL